MRAHTDCKRGCNRLGNMDARRAWVIVEMGAEGKEGTRRRERSAGGGACHMCRQQQATQTIGGITLTAAKSVGPIGGTCSVSYGAFVPSRACHTRWSGPSNGEVHLSTSLTNYGVSSCGWGCAHDSCKQGSDVIHMVRRKGKGFQLWSWRFRLWWWWQWLRQMLWWW